MFFPSGLQILFSYSLHVIVIIVIFLCSNFCNIVSLFSVEDDILMCLEFISCHLCDSLMPGLHKQLSTLKNFFWKVIACYLMHEEYGLASCNANAENIENYTKALLKVLIALKF